LTQVESSPHFRKCDPRRPLVWSQVRLPTPLPLTGGDQDGPAASPARQVKGRVPPGGTIREPGMPHSSVIVNLESETDELIREVSSSRRVSHLLSAPGVGHG